jgi:subfamily B ATP-binding cassette protein HlyB/CyaB
MPQSTTQACDVGARHGASPAVRFHAGGRPPAWRRTAALTESGNCCRLFAMRPAYDVRIGAARLPANRRRRKRSQPPRRELWRGARIARAVAVGAVVSRARWPGACSLRFTRSPWEGSVATTRHIDAPDGDAAACTAPGAPELLWALESLARLHRLPVDAALLAQQFPPPHSRAMLAGAAAALGLRLERIATAAAGLDGPASPCLAFTKPAADAPPRAAILVAAGADRLLLFEAGAERARTIARAECDAVFEPDAFLATRAESDADDAGRAAAPRERFGFRWFVPELVRHRAVWRDVITASLVLQLVALATPVFTQVIIDKVVVHRTESTLVVIGIALAVFLVFNAAMTWARQYLVLHTGNRIDAVLGARVFKHLFALPVAYFERRPTGTLTARLQGIESIREFLTGAAVAVLLDLPFAVIFLAVMFWYSWQLSLIALGLIGLIAALSVAVTPLLRERLNRQFLAGARNQAFLTEYIAGAETVKSLQMEPQLERRYGELLARYLATSFAARSTANGYNTVVGALEQAMTVSILVVGALFVMRGDGFTIGMLVAFQMFAARLSQPVLRLAGLWQSFQQASIAVQRLGDVMDAPPEPVAVTATRALARDGGVAIEGLSFRYDPQHPYLFRDFSLAVAPGRSVAIMGPSGCGKSTLAKLLQGFYPPADGVIRVDGRDIRHLAANELRQYFGVVPQETRLFSGTIFDNLAIANPLASFEDMVLACEMAEVHEVIERLPQGYQTPIGEQGAGLSGGQKQRLAIARALLKRPRILVFDEATSQLDPATAEAFAQTINRLKGRATILFITHQLPRSLRVDEIVQLGATRPGKEDAAPLRAEA